MDIIGIYAAWQAKQNSISVLKLQFLGKMLIVFLVKELGCSQNVKGTSFLKAMLNLILRNTLE